MALLGRTDIEDELLRQNLLRNISIHRINFPDKIIEKINMHNKLIDIGDLKEVADKVYAILQEYVVLLKYLLNIHFSDSKLIIYKCTFYF